jgi:hypothetical protein
VNAPLSISTCEPALSIAPITHAAGLAPRKAGAASRADSRFWLRRWAQPRPRAKVQAQLPGVGPFTALVAAARETDCLHSTASARSLHRPPFSARTHQTIKGQTRMIGTAPCIICRFTAPGKLEACPDVIDRVKTFDGTLNDWIRGDCVFQQVTLLRRGR